MNVEPRVHIRGRKRADLRRKVVRLYQEGHSMVSIARMLGRSYHFIQCLLAEAEVERRPRGGWGHR